MAEDFLEHVSIENRKLENDDLPLNAALRNGRELDLRATIRHKDGHLVKVHVRAIPLRDEFGKLLGAAEFFEPAEPQLWQDERQNMLAIHGRLERSTGGARKVRGTPGYTPKPPLKQFSPTARVIRRDFT